MRYSRHNSEQQQGWDADSGLPAQTPNWKAPTDRLFKNSEFTEWSAALKRSKPERLHIGSESDGSLSATFLNEHGTAGQKEIVKLTADAEQSQWGSFIRSVKKAAQGAGTTVVDGAIFSSPASGAVFLVFNRDAVPQTGGILDDKIFKQWKAAVSALPDHQALLRFFSKDDRLIMSLTTNSGRHYVTALSRIKGLETELMQTIAGMLPGRFELRADQKLGGAPEWFEDLLRSAVRPPAQ